jgi:hypothetical protein
MQGSPGFPSRHIRPPARNRRPLVCPVLPQAARGTHSSGGPGSVSCACPAPLNALNLRATKGGPAGSVRVLQLDLPLRSGRLREDRNVPWGPSYCLWPKGREQPPTCSDNSDKADWCPRALYGLHPGAGLGTKKEDARFLPAPSMPRTWGGTAVEMCCPVGSSSGNPGDANRPTCSDNSAEADWCPPRPPHGLQARLQRAPGPCDASSGTCPLQCGVGDGCWR